MNDWIPLAIPSVGDLERRYLNQCIDDNFVSSVGPFVDQFEREFAAFVGSRFAVACSTGTAAIHVALRLLGIAEQDEVWVSDFTFIASVNPLAYERARPVLVDSEPVSWNLDPALMVAEIERRAAHSEPMPKAIEVVHILGHPANLEPLLEVCATHDIAIFEDAAESLGARWTGGSLDGRHVGTVGALGCFSFNGNKIMTTGGGGMLVTDDESLATRAKHLTTQARLPGPEYRHDEVGYNYRLTNVAAGMGIAQLQRLPGFVDTKRRIASRYRAALETIPGLTAMPQAAWGNPTFWLYSMAVDPEVFGMDRTALFELLRARKISSRPLWNPIHAMPMYADATRLTGTPNISEQIFARGLSIPCSVDMTDAEQDRVIAALNEARA